MRGYCDLGSTAEWQPTSASAERGGARDWARRSCCWRRVVVQRRRSTWLEESYHLVSFHGGGLSSSGRETPGDYFSTTAGHAAECGFPTVRYFR